MTGESDNTLDSIAAVLDDETRRSFMRKGAAATGVAAVGAGATGTAAAGGGGGGVPDGQKALIFADNFHPFGRFTFVSPVIDWFPNYQEVRSSAWSSYNTRQIRWQGTGNVVNLWVAQDAEIGQYDSDLGFVTDADDDGNQPQLFEMDRDWTPFSDNPRLMTVSFSPVGEEEEDDILDNDDWWQGDGGGGGGDGGG